MLNQNPLPNDLIDVSAAARTLRVSLTTLHRWIARRRIRAWKIGHRWKLSAADVAAYRAAVPVRCNLDGPDPGPDGRTPLPSQAQALAQLRRDGYRV